MEIAVSLLLADADAQAQGIALAVLLATGFFIFLVVSVVIYIIKIGVKEGIIAAGTHPQSQPGQMDPPVEDGPGMYEVAGVDRASRMDTTWRVRAESAENAKVKGELEGIVITSVRRIG
jgi:hypothetical protein